MTTKKHDSIIGVNAKMGNPIYSTSRKKSTNNTLQFIKQWFKLKEL
jgi:hypothetical protein